MFSSFAISVLLVAQSLGPSNYFGDFDRRSAAAIAVDLDSVAQVPAAAFDEIAPSVLEIIQSARPNVLMIRALDLYCAKASESRASELVTYLNQCLSAIAIVPPEANRAEWMRKHAVIYAFVSGRASNWSDGMRNSQAVVSFLSQVANYTGYHLDLSLYRFAVDNLMELLPNESSKRQLLLALISQNAPGARSDQGARQLLSDEQSRQILRTLANSQTPNRTAVEILAHIGDAPSLPILTQKRDSALADGQTTLVSFLNQSIKRISLQHPSSDLIDYIRTPDDDGFTHVWAVHRAKELNLDQAAIRAALLEWGAGAEPLQVAGIKLHATSAGILQATDLPDVPPCLAQKFSSHSHVERREGPVPVPDRRPKQDRWEPNQANYPALGTWLNSVNWQSIPDADAVNMIHEKMCELELLNPEICTNNDAPQEDGP